MLTILSAAVSQDLTTLAAARTECGLTDTSDDAILLPLIRQASAACARYCGRPHFGREHYEQTENTSRSSGALILERDLEPTVVSVTAAGAAVSASDYELQAGGVLRRVGAHCYSWAWPVPVVVNYYAGFTLLTTLPDDIERACLTVLRGWYYARRRDPTIRTITSEGIGMTAFATPTSGDGFSLEAAAMLEPWRRLSGF
jgi:hypothetical protein